MPRRKQIEDSAAIEPAEGQLKLELRKRSNVDDWVSTINETRSSNSRSSTPLSHSPSLINGTCKRPRGRPRKNLPPSEVVPKKKRGRPKLEKQKQFRMVLEKDDAFEVDYISSDDRDGSDSSLDGTSRRSLSDDSNVNSDNEDGYLDNDECSSVEDLQMSLWADEVEDNYEEKDLPPLDTPESSTDLLIPKQLILPALAVYEVLRHFRNTLRLSPMLFEDFCAALITKDSTVLLNECHIALLKSLMKEEDHSNTMFTPQDQKDAYYVAFYFTDYLTWPEVLRYYVESCPDFKNILPFVEEKDFPSVEPEKKLKVLQFLTNMFLASTKIRDELMMHGTIHYDDHCRVCHRLGDLLCCETCPAVYHLACCTPPLKEVPEDEWQCEVCIAHKLNGVSNCESEGETSGQYLRHEPIGTDRHGRKYWFLARRLIIEEEDNTNYYSTLEQFQQIRLLLDPIKYEKLLCETLDDIEEDFSRQSEITNQLTNEAKWKDETKTCIEVMKEKAKTQMNENKSKAAKLAEMEKEVKEEERTEAKKLTLKETEDGPQSKVDKEENVESIDQDETSCKLLNGEKSNDAANSTDEVLPCGQPKQNEPDVANHTETDSRDQEEEHDVKLPEEKVLVSNADSLVNVTIKSEVGTSEGLAHPSANLITTQAPRGGISAPGTKSFQVLSADTKSVTMTGTQQIPGLPIKLANIKVPLSRCDALVGSGIMTLSQVKTQSAVKVTPKVQIKSGTSAGNATPLRNLFVLAKDGTRTPIAIGPGNKITTGTPNKILVINSAAKSVTPTTTSSSKVSRELRRLQFSGAGPKMQKMLAVSTTSSSAGEVQSPAEGGVGNTSASENTTTSKSLQSAAERKPFRLGEDGGYKQYKNHFVENYLALNKYQHKEDKDRDRHVSYKFSIGGPVEFEWNGNLCGSREDIVHTLRSALFRFEQQIPLCFMHSKWEQYRKMWGRMLLKNDSTRAFAMVLGILEMAIRDNVKTTTWKDGMGQSRMRKLLANDKEIYEKKKKHRARVEEEVAQRKAVWCKHPIPVRNTMVSKMRGEEYRSTGYGGWMWLSASFQSNPKPYKSKPSTVVHDGSNIGQMQKSTTIEDEELMESSTCDTAIPNAEQLNGDKLSTSSDDTLNAANISKQVQILMNSSDVIDVSKNLLVRTVLYNLKWQPSKLDKLLRWRILQEKQRVLNDKKTPAENKVGEGAELPSNNVIKTDATSKGDQLEISDEEGEGKTASEAVMSNTDSTSVQSCNEDNLAIAQQLSGGDDDPKPLSKGPSELKDPCGMSNTPTTVVKNCLAETLAAPALHAAKTAGLNESDDAQSSATNSVVLPNSPSVTVGESVPRENDSVVDVSAPVTSSHTIQSTAASAAVGSVATYAYHHNISRRFRTVRTFERKRLDDLGKKVRSSTQRSWKLKRSPADSSKKKSIDVKMPIPWKFSSGKGRRKNMFRLPFSHVKNLASSGGTLRMPSGFHLTPKLPPCIELFWPYPCPRPTIGTVWRYKVQNASTLAAIAHLFRVLWHSIRWEDMVMSPASDDMVHVVHTDEDIVTTELLKRRDADDSGLRSEYFVRKIRVATAECDEEIPRSEAYTPSSRSGLRMRSRPMSLRERAKKETCSRPRVETLWLPENKIELWQIQHFHRMLRTQQKNLPASSSTPSSNREAAPATKAKLVSLDKLPSIPKPPPVTTKHVTITPALLQQAAALHRTQVVNTSDSRINPALTNTQTYAKIIQSSKHGSTSDMSSEGTSTTLHTITIKARTQQPTFLALRPNTGSASDRGSIISGDGAVIQVPSNSSMLKGSSTIQYVVQGSKSILGRQILVKQDAGSTIPVRGVHLSSPHPTIRLASKPSPSIQSQEKLSMKAAIPIATAQSPSSTPKAQPRMQVTLSSAQLTQLMKVGTSTRVRVSIKLSDGRPGVGHLQVIPPGAQVTPTQGQQLMQCKVGSEVRRFLLTALSEKVPVTQQIITHDNEVSVKTPSLRHRLEQLQQRHQNLLKQPGTDVRRLMTDKDPLWGGRPAADKQVSHERTIRKEMFDRPRKRQSLSRENREEQQRKTVVQQLMKSMLDRVERKEELEVRKRKKEEQLVLQKKKRESLDEAKTQQRLHHRLVHALKKHGEQLRQEIRKRKIITEKYITRVIENELYEDKVKKRRKHHNPGVTPQQENISSDGKPVKRASNQRNIVDTSHGNVLTESNSHQPSSPKKRQIKDSRKRSLPPVDDTNSKQVPSKKNRMISTSSKVYCICQTPYDDTKFYIGCDLCMNWFHGDCVGISERKAKLMENWICVDCTKEQSTPQQELYCLCRTPYDDAQFYIGCDVCQDWYHGSCVGISEDDASGIESYTCPKCKKNAKDASQEGALCDQDYYNLTRIIRHLQNHKMAWPFLEPVREGDVPDYYRVVKRPMDLGTVSKRLECRYYAKLSEVVGDVSLIFDNCRQFNGADSKIVRCAEIVESVFVGKMRDLRGRKKRK